MQIFVFFQIGSTKSPLHGKSSNSTKGQCSSRKRKQSSSGGYPNDRPKPGVLLIINNLSNDQPATQQDVKHLQGSGCGIGMDVPEPMLNLTLSQLEDYAKNLETQDYSRCNLCFLVIISHGAQVIQTY